MTIAIINPTCSMMWLCNYIHFLPNTPKSMIVLYFGVPLIWNVYFAAKRLSIHESSLGQEEPRGGGMHLIDVKSHQTCPSKSNATYILYLQLHSSTHNPYHNQLARTPTQYMPTTRNSFKAITRNTIKAVSLGRYLSMRRPSLIRSKPRSYPFRRRGTLSGCQNGHM